MRKPLPKKSRLLIEAAVELLFERAKARLLGPDPRKRAALTSGKQLAFSFHPELTLPALFAAASHEEGVMTPNEELISGLMGIASNYLDAQKEKTKAQVVHTVQTFLHDAHQQGVKTDVETVLGGQLAELWGKVHSDVKKIVETETTIARNMGIDDAIQQMSALVNVSDPVVYFVVVRDGHRCDECTRLHLMPDGVTPRVWLRSQVKSGYHKKGEDAPSVGGLHPHCRCVMAVLMPGFGFNVSGSVQWKSRSWNQLEVQQRDSQT